MPLLIDTESRTDTLVVAINHQLALHGPGGVTLRQIGRVSGVSPSSMLHHFGSREHLVRVAAYRTARARLSSIEQGLYRGPVAFLPACAEDVVDLRAWLAWQELWRCEPTLEGCMTKERAAERAMLARTFEYLRPLPDLESITSTIDGLAVELCRPARPMSPVHAREILTTSLSQRGWWPLPDRPGFTLPPIFGSWM